MPRLLPALFLLSAFLLLADPDADAQQPARPKPKPKVPKVEKSDSPPAAADALLGTWRMIHKNSKHEEELVVAFEKGKWSIRGVWTMDGKEVGRFHGEQIALAKGTLHFAVVVDEKPPFDLLPNTRGGLSSAREDRGKVGFVARTEKSTHTWHRDYERTAKPVAVAVAPKTEPKVEPKVEPKPKTEPKAEPTRLAEPYTSIALVKGVHNGCLSPDGQTFYGLSLEGNSKAAVAFDLKKKEVVKRIKMDFPDRVAVSADGRVLAVADYRGFGTKDYATKVFAYDTKTWEKVGEFDHPGAGSHLAISADGGRVAVGSSTVGADGTGKLNVWDVAKNKVIYSAPVSSYLAMDLAADGKTLVMNAQGPEKFHIGFIDVDTGKPKTLIKGLAERLVISSDGKLAVGAHGNKLTVYDAAKKSAKELPPPGQGGISALALIDDNKRLVTGGSVAETFVVALDGGKVEKTFKLEPAKGEKAPKGGKLLQAAFLRTTPDSSLLLTVGADRVARVWTLPFGKKKGE